MHHIATALMVANAYRAGLSPRVPDPKETANPEIQAAYNDLSSSLSSVALERLKAIEDNLRALAEMNSLDEFTMDTPPDEDALVSLLNTLVETMRNYDKTKHQRRESSWYLEMNTY